jgi:hypothetical protein
MAGQENAYQQNAYLPAVFLFIDKVGQLFAGNLKVEMAYGSQETLVFSLAPDGEQQVVEAVAAGDFDLAWAGTRVFDTSGAHPIRRAARPASGRQLPAAGGDHRQRRRRADAGRAGRDRPDWPRPARRWAAQTSGLPQQDHADDLELINTDRSRLSTPEEVLAVQPQQPFGAPPGEQLGVLPPSAPPTCRRMDNRARATRSTRTALTFGRRCARSTSSSRTGKVGEGDARSGGHTIALGLIIQRELDHDLAPVIANRTHTRVLEHTHSTAGRTTAPQPALRRRSYVLSRIATSRGTRRSIIPRDEHGGSRS